MKKPIYFLDNTEGEKYLHCYLKELNESITELFIIDDKQYKYQKFFVPKKEGIYKIKIIIKINLTDCNYMFAYCSCITSIDLSSFNTSELIYMSNIFLECSNLISINL